MYWIREAFPNLAEDEEDRGPVQEPPTKKQNIGRRHAAPFGTGGKHLLTHTDRNRDIIK